MANSTENTIRTTKVKNNAKPDYKIATLSSIGALGFLIGCIVLFYPNLFSFEANSNFHEVIYQPRISAKKVISYSIDTLTKAISIHDSIIAENEKKTVKNSAGKLVPDLVASNDNLKLKSSNTADSGTLKALLNFKCIYDTASLADTFSFNKFNSLLHYQITPESIDKWNHSFNILDYTKNDNWTATADYYFIDEKDIITLHGKEIFHIKSYTSDIDFITKYPNAGTWIILILIFCSFSFIAVALCIYLNNKIFDLFENSSLLKHKVCNETVSLLSKRYYRICLIIFLILAILFIVWKLTFYDDTIIKSLYFFSLTNSMAWVLFFGYIAGTFCLAGFIHSSSILSYFIEEGKPKLKKDIVATTSEDVNANSEKIKIFENLYSIFNTYFILSSIILSLLVLCTGALFSTVNSLDFVKLLSNDWGYSPARSDFVYLYAGLHTVILLLVYIPSKMRFNELRLLYETPTQPQPAGDNLSNFLQNPFTTQLKDVLVATSPLLAGLLQSLFSIFFNK